MVDFVELQAVYASTTTTLASLMHYVILLDHKTQRELKMDRAYVDVSVTLTHQPTGGAALGLVL